MVKTSIKVKEYTVVATETDNIIQFNFENYYWRLDIKSQEPVDKAPIRLEELLRRVNNQPGVITIFNN